MSERLMTYDELAEALGRTPEAARQIVKRRRWRRTMGNDGKARIAVPLDELETDRATGGRPPADQAPASSEPDRPTAGRPGDDRPDVTGILTGLIGRLERDLEALRKEHDAERDGRRKAEAERETAIDARRELASQVELIRVALEAEQAATAAERATTAREIARAEELRAERDRWHALASRPWWRRLVG